METKLNPNRRHELDWLRVFAILALLFFHTGWIFNDLPWHIKNNETSDSFKYWMPFLRSWRMPLLLFISGVGSYYALGRSTTFQFVGNRMRRLLIPIIFAIVVVLPLHAYYEHIGEYSNYWDFYRSVFNYIPFENGRLHIYNIWFIAYLFIYTLIVLPVLIFLRSPYAVGFQRKVLRHFYHPILLLLLPPTFIVITQFIFFPAHQGRAFFAFYLCFFLFGIIFYSNKECMEIIRKNRRYFLAAAVLILIPYFLDYTSKEGTYIPDNFTITFVLEIFVGWSWIIAIVAYAQHYFNRPNRILSTVGEGIYSFYILHQTVIVVIGYYVCQLSWSISTKFWMINFLTLAFCMIFYLICIRPFNVMRFLFGMKPKAVSRKYTLQHAQ